MSRKKMLAIGIGIVLGIVVIILGFTLLQGVFTRAGDVQPRDVVISSVTENSARVTWTTDQESLSNIEYGTSPTALTFSAPETEKTKNHSVDLTLLSKNTTYYFQIAVGDQKFDNGGIPWTFTTRNGAENQQATVDLTPTASPTAVLTSPTATSTPTVVNSSCNYANCEDMKAQFGKGCTTQDYFKCVRSKQTTPIP